MTNDSYQDFGKHYRPRIKSKGEEKLQHFIEGFLFVPVYILVTLVTLLLVLLPMIVGCYIYDIEAFHIFALITVVWVSILAGVYNIYSGGVIKIGGNK